MGIHASILQAVQKSGIWFHKVHHERVDNITTFVPMTRCCGTILVTTKDLSDLNSWQHTCCAEKLVIVVQVESGPYPSCAAVASIRLSPAVSLQKWASR